MTNVYTVKATKRQSSDAVLSRRLAKEMGFDKKKRGWVGFGASKFYVDFTISDRADDNEILLSKNVIEDLHIPPYPDFEIRASGNGLMIGPCIGVLAGSRLKDIAEDRLEHVASAIGDYGTLHGAVIVFALDGVDDKERLIKGYCYNPASKSWQMGVFPYPGAIYRTTGLSPKWQNHFLSTIGDCIFNSRYFSKWEMYKWFSAEHTLSPHVPYTLLLKDSDDIYNTLRRFEEIYIKPNWGMKGHGVVKATLQQNGKAIFQYRKDKKNITLVAETREEEEKIIKSLFNDGEFIVQQGIDLLSDRGGVVDFRVVMQKDDTGRWLRSVIVARVGAKESVVSNISSGGKGLMPSELLQEAMGLSVREAHKFENRMYNFCMTVSEMLDEFGINCGTLGIDLGVDKHGKIWLIEINHRSPHPAIALLIKDVDSYNAIISNPLRYGKYIAGFGK